MGRLERPLAPDAGPVTAFARELRRLRTAAGSPGYRDMATRAMFSASVLSDAAAGYRLPTLQVALAFAEACGGDRATWERRWHEAARAEPEDGTPDLRPRPYSSTRRTNCAPPTYEPYCPLRPAADGAPRPGGAGRAAPAGQVADRAEQR